MISAHEANALATARINRDLARMLARVEAVPVQGHGQIADTSPATAALYPGGSPKDLDRGSHT